MLTFLPDVLKYLRICKNIAETKQWEGLRSERGMVKALGPNTASHFQRCPG
jgi:hypothetical protein